jgi:Bacteriodetes cell division protein (FtsL-like)
MAAPNPNKGKSNQPQNAPKPAQKPAPPAAPAKAAGGSGGITISAKWVEYSQVGSMASNLIFGNLSYVFFVFFLLLIYIANALNSERKIRQIQRLEKEIKELRWQYMSAKADLMLESKQSEVLKSVEPLGLNTNNARRKRIIVQE